ncbi:zonular occludens toxin, partial [Vibrio sinaloensis]|nr:zonular occludens toxin [Vibrio sinaloensis]
YMSTGTGGFNESKADVTILKSPKFILVILVGLLALGNFVRESYALYVGNSDDTVETPSQKVNTDFSNVEDGTSLALDENKNTSQSSISVASGRDSSQDSVEVVSDAVNPFYQHFPIFNQARAVYLTGVVKQRMDDGLTLTNYRFRIDKDEGEYYINSPVLVSHGYEFVQFDDCIIQVKLNDVVSMLTCPPRGEPQKTNDIGSFDRSQKLQEVDIFNLAKNSDQV